MLNIVCCDKKCGVVFGIPDHVYNQARNDPERIFQCPNGHGQHYAESEVERLKKKVADLEATIEQKLALVYRLEDDATKADRRIAYWKGIAHRRRK